MRRCLTGVASATSSVADSMDVLNPAAGGHNHPRLHRGSQVRLPSYAHTCIRVAQSCLELFTRVGEQGGASRWVVCSHASPANCKHHGVVTLHFSGLCPVRLLMWVYVADMGGVRCSSRHSCAYLPVTTFGISVHSWPTVALSASTGRGRTQRSRQRPTFASWRLCLCCTPAAIGWAPCAHPPFAACAAQPHFAVLCSAPPFPAICGWKLTTS